MMTWRHSTISVTFPSVSLSLFYNNFFSQLFSQHELSFYVSALNRQILSQSLMDLSLIEFLSTGRDHRILGATFLFDYSFHSIPTVRFSCSFGGKTIAYSSDTLFDPQKYKEFREQVYPSHFLSLSLSLSLSLIFSIYLTN